MSRQASDDKLFLYELKKGKTSAVVRHGGGYGLCATGDRAKTTKHFAEDCRSSGLEDPAFAHIHTTRSEFRA